MSGMTSLASRTARVCGTAGALALSACSTARVVSDHDLAGVQATRPAVVYVANFELDPAAVRAEGLLSRMPLQTIQRRFTTNSLAGVMQKSIVADLKKKGVQAQRLAAGEAVPTSGWLVRGRFVTVDDGNRVKRAIVGFGAGQTDLEITLAVDNLTRQGGSVPMRELQTNAVSGKSPGAVVTMNPIGAAMKFVLSGLDLDIEARKSAAQIADSIVAKVNASA